MGILPAKTDENRVIFDGAEFGALLRQMESKDLRFQR
jgi:hypothetical protein